MARARAKRRVDPIEKWEWAVAIAAVLAGAFVIFPDAGNPVDLIKATLVVVAGLALLALAAVRLVRDRTLLLSDMAFSAVVGVFALALIVSAVASAQTTRAFVGTYMRWTGAGPYLAYAVIGITVARVARSPERRRLMAQIILWSAVVLAIYALMQRVGLDPIPWNLVYGNSAPSALGNPNFASAFFGIPIPIAGMLVAQRKARIRGVAAIGVLFAGMWATNSWLGPFAALCGTVLGTSLYLFSDEDRRRRVAGVFLASGFGVAGALTYSLMLASAIPTPFAVAIRFYYFDAALHMWADAPIFGIGFGRYQDFFRSFRSAEGFEQFGTRAVADGPHSGPLGLLSGGGLVVLLPYLVVLALIAWYAIRSAQIADRGNDRLLVAGIGGAWAGFVLQSVGNYDVPQLAILGWVLGGMVAASAAPEIVRLVLPSVASTLTTVAVGALVVVGLVVVWRPLRADVAGREAIVLEARGDLEGAIGSAVRAADLGFWDSRYQHTVGRLEYNAGDVEASYRAFTQAAEKFPDEWDPVLAAAQVSAEVGRYEESVSWYRRAVVIDPFDSGVRNEFGQALMLAGNNEEAAQVFEALVADDPADIQSWGFLGEVYSRLGRQAEADAAFARVAELEQAGG